MALILRSMLGLKAAVGCRCEHDPPDRVSLMLVNAMAKSSLAVCNSSRGRFQELVEHERLSQSGSLSLILKGMISTSIKYNGRLKELQVRRRTGMLTRSYTPDCFTSAV